MFGEYKLMKNVIIKMNCFIGKIRAFHGFIDKFLLFCVIRSCVKSEMYRLLDDDLLKTRVFYFSL